MIRLAASIYLGLNATYKALTFKPGWHGELDVSMAGFWRSFAAIIPSVVMLWLILLGQSSAGYTIPLASVMLSFAVSWLVYPGVAAVVCTALGVRDKFVPWVVMMNWGRAWLYIVLGFLWMLRTSGLVGTALPELFLILFQYIRFLVYWRLAYVSLGLPTITAAFAGAVPLIVSWIATALVYQAFLPPAG